MTRVRVIDSHTGGEPTRVVIEGGPTATGDSMPERRESLRSQDHFRRGILGEPRGSAVLVGAFLTPPVSPGSASGVVFANNAGYLGMCGHGTIGVIETLRHLGRVEPGPVSLDTPVGTVRVELSPSHDVSLTNVPSYRYAKGIDLDIRGLGRVVGDVAYGGNWFFIVRTPTVPICLERAHELTEQTLHIRHELEIRGITGGNGAEIDHVELFGAPSEPGRHSRNFVMCPGGEYDRSPCGTGTCAKLACLFEDGLLAEGEEYVQESVTGSTFAGSVRLVDGKIVPTIRGRAYVTAESELVFDGSDPLRWGLG